MSTSIYIFMGRMLSFRQYKKKHSLPDFPHWIFKLSYAWLGPPFLNTIAKMSEQMLCKYERACKRPSTARHNGGAVAEH